MTGMANQRLAMDTMEAGYLLNCKTALSSPKANPRRMQKTIVSVGDATKRQQKTEADNPAPEPADKLPSCPW